MVLGEDAHGSRLDRALVTALEAAGHCVTRSRLAKAFAAGSVEIDGKPAKASSKVEGAPTVTVTIPELEPLSAVPEPMDLAILFEDEHLLVVDKPAGLPVHPGPGHPSQTLVNGVVHHVGDLDLPILPGNDASRPGIVHRIDKDTSGVLVISKHAAAQEGLAQQFRAHSIDRLYIALVHGAPRFTEAQRVETPHGRDPADRRRFSPNVQASRRAISYFRVRERYADAAMLEARLETGRTHQIRMHARHLGHPLLGDAVYGPRRPPSILPVVDALDRQALHAARLGFVHPIEGTKVVFESPLPPDLAAAVAALRESGML